MEVLCPKALALKVGKNIVKKFDSLFFRLVKNYTFNKTGYIDLIDRAFQNRIVYGISEKQGDYYLLIQ